MKYTLNYNYKKPDYTDPADIKDINDNFDSVDVKFKEIDDVLGSGVVATLTLSYGMNSKIVNPVKVPVIPEVAWSGRHYVNLLGKDGNCEDVSKWTQGGLTLSSDISNKVFGLSSLKGILTSAGGYTDLSGTVRNELIPKITGKYLFFSVYLKNGNLSSGVRGYWNTDGIGQANLYTGYVTDTINFTRVGLKLPAATVTSMPAMGMHLLGSIGQYAYMDGVQVNEITAEEYNNLTVEQLLEKYSYVDSYGILTNPYIEIRHDNLVRNGNGEEGINWWSLSYGNTNPRIENGYFVVEDNNASANNGYNQIVPCKPNTQYTFSTVCKRGTATAARIQILDADTNALLANVTTTNTTDTKISATVTTSSDTKRLRVSMISGSIVADTGVAYHKEAMIVEGSSTPSYKPCRMERCVIEGKFGDGDTVTLKNGKAEGLINWKHKTLYGKDYDWIYSSTTTGRKVVRLNSCMPGVDILTDGRYALAAIKYDEKILPAGTITDVDQITSDRPNGTLWVSISTTDSGWLDATNPNADEIKAFMNGWKAAGAYGSRYVVWVSVVDGNVLPAGGLTTTVASAASAGQAVINFTDASQFNVGDLITVKNSAGAWNTYAVQSKSTNAVTMSSNLISAISSGASIIRSDNGTTNVSLLTWCKNNVAPGYEGYQLHYKLANPEPITDANTKIVGDIPKIDTGDNYVYVDSGMVLGEIAIVGSGGGWSRINHTTYPESALKNRANNIIDILKNEIYDSNSWTISAAADGYYDRVGANMTTATLDANAIYTIDYKILDTVAPNAGTIALTFKQDLVSGVTSVANALESRQKSNLALDRVVDLSVYEEINVNGAFCTMTSDGAGVAFVQIVVPFKVKKNAVPRISLKNLKILLAYLGTDLTAKFSPYASLIKVDTDSVMLTFRIVDAVDGALVRAQNTAMTVKIIADCRGVI
ncbi:MAG: hypothetical protein K0S61_120 [Anaerocolumna sp.]|jgi:hypothetical protein|nr:hypothetical protein [Anaerocolumna sp.]